MRKFKKMLSMLLALVMVLSIAPITADATARSGEINITSLQVNDTIAVGSTILGKSSGVSTVFVTGAAGNIDCSNGGSVSVGSTMLGVTTTSGKWLVSVVGQYGVQIEPAPNHTHSWGYETVGNELFMYCKNSGCSYYTTTPASSSYYYQIDAATATYDGKAHAITTSSNIIPDVNIGTPVTTYYTDLNRTIETTNTNSDADSNGGAPKKPGTYYVKTAITISGSTYYIYTSYTINKADQTAAINNYTIEWDKTSDLSTDSTLTPTLSFTKIGDAPNGTASIYYSKTNDYSTKKAWGSEDYIEPGTYYLFADVTGNDYYNPLEIKQGKQFTVTGNEAVDFNVENIEKTYDGEECSIDVESVIGNLYPGMEANYKVTYSETGDEGSYTEVNPSYTDADKYTVYYKVNSRNYYEIKGSATITIKPKEVSPIVTADDKVYDGNNTATVSASFAEGSFIGDDSLSMTGLTATFDDVDGVAGTGRNVGTDKKVTVNAEDYNKAAESVTAAEGTATKVTNYKIVAPEKNENLENITASITPATAEIAWNDVTEITCADVEKQTKEGSGDAAADTNPVGITVTKINPDDTFAVEYDVERYNKDGDEAKEDVLTVGVTDLGNSNYVLPEDPDGTILSKTVDINHSGELSWITTERTHKQQWDCCSWIVVDEENHEWEGGKCVECEYVCAHAGGEANCVDKAVCEICGESYGKIAPDNHKNLKHFKAKAATTTAEGNIEYWYCDSCDKYYSDKAAAKEISKAETVIEKLPEDTAETGDMNSMIFWLALMLLAAAAATGTTAIARKRR